MTQTVVTNPNQELWEKGDFTEIARYMRRSGEALVTGLGIASPLRALDLGCGDGTTAFPLAALGADVVGIDIARNLVDAGNKRAAEARLERITFQHGDASDLRDVTADSFDLTLSVFGAMFAPKPFDVAREMVRVTKPGGRIVMGNWIPNDETSFVSRLLTISAAYTPPPPEGFVSPMTWGVPANVIERFVAAGMAPEQIEYVKDVFMFAAHDKTPAQFVDAFRRFYGPTMNAFAAARASGREDELHERLLQLLQEQNASPDGSISIPATFLRVTVRK